MSVITHRPFASVVRSSGYGNQEKLTDLLNRLGLTNRIVKDIKTIPNMLKQEIDYHKVDTIIKRERIRSYEYLERQIKN
jgi:hypothetical protein